MPPKDELLALFSSEEDKAIATEIYDLLPAPLAHYAQKLIEALKALDTADQGPALIKGLKKLLKVLSDKSAAIKDLADYFKLSARLGKLSDFLIDEGDSKQEQGVINLITAITHYPHYISPILENLDCFRGHEAEFIREVCNILNSLNTYGGIGFVYIPQLTTSADPRRSPLLFLQEDRVNMALTELIASGLLTETHELYILQIFYLASTLFYKSDKDSSFSTTLCDQDTVNSLLTLATEFPAYLEKLMGLISKINELNPDLTFSPTLIKLLLASIQPSFSEQTRLFRRVLCEERLYQSDIRQFLDCLKLIDDESSNLLLAGIYFYGYKNSTAALERLFRIPDLSTKQSSASRFFRTALLALKSDPESAHSLIKMSSSHPSQVEFFTRIFPGFNIFHADQVYKASLCYSAEKRSLSDGLILDPMTTARAKKYPGLFIAPATDDRKRTGSEETLVLEEGAMVASPTASSGGRLG